MDAKAWDKIKGQELVAWLQSESTDARELIVQVQTPPRQVTMKRHPSGRVQPGQVQENDARKRQKAIDDLATVLNSLVDTPPVVLRTSGAVVVKATSDQVRRFVDHRLVKAIYPNRSLSKTSSSPL